MFNFDHCKMRIIIMCQFGNMHIVHFSWWNKVCRRILLLKFPLITNIVNNSWLADLKCTGHIIEMNLIKTCDIDTLEIHGLAQDIIICQGIIRIQNIEIPYEKSLLLNNRFSDNCFLDSGILVFWEVTAIS